MGVALAGDLRLCAGLDTTLDRGVPRLPLFLLLQRHIMASGEAAQSKDNNGRQVIHINTSTDICGFG